MMGTLIMILFFIENPFIIDLSAQSFHDTNLQGRIPFTNIKHNPKDISLKDLISHSFLNQYYTGYFNEDLPHIENQDIKKSRNVINFSGHRDSLIQNLSQEIQFDELALKNSPCESNLIIPNAGFESWHLEWNFVWNPDYWNTNNIPNFGYVNRNTSSYAGSYCAWIGPAGNCRIGLSCNNHPESLSIFVKAFFWGEDTVSIHVVLYLDGMKTDSGIWTCQTPITEWTEITIPITAFSSEQDSIEIILNGGKNIGALVVDEVSLNIIDNIMVIPPIKTLNFYPNPCTSISTLCFQGNPLYNYTLVIYQINGRIIQFVTGISGNQVSVSREVYPPGIYYYRLYQNHKVFATGEFVVL